MPPPRRGGSFESGTGVFDNKLPVPAAGMRVVTWLHSIFYEHGCTGLTGLTAREVPASEAGWGDDPVRACRCSGCQASRFLKNPVHPVHPCESNFLFWRPISNAGNHRVSFSVPGGPFLNPFSFTRNRGAFPSSGSRTPSFFVCLRGPSCDFVDNSFFVSGSKPKQRSDS